MDLPVQIGARLVGEGLVDERLVAAYGPTSVSGEVVATAEVRPGWIVRAAGGFRRLGGHELSTDLVPVGESTWTWYAPIAFVGGPRLDTGRARLEALAGPTLVVWGATPGSESGDSGVKQGMLVEAGISVAPTRDPSLRVGADLGWRATWMRHCDGAACGLDFSALRLSLGLEVEL